MNSSESQSTPVMNEEELLPHVAYGPVRSQEVMERIVGGNVKKLGHVAIDDVILVEQRLSDVSDEGEPSPRDILAGVVDKDTFSSLGAVPEDEDPERGVGGTLFALTPEQKAKLDAYELVPEGWFERKEVEVIHPDGTKGRAETHVLSGDFQSSRRVPDGEQRPLSGKDKDSLLRSIDKYNESVKPK
jgi:hypothetical protein